MVSGNGPRRPGSPPVMSPQIMQQIMGKMGGGPAGMPPGFGVERGGSGMRFEGQRGGVGGVSGGRGRAGGNQSAVQQAILRRLRGSKGLR